MVILLPILNSIFQSQVYLASPSGFSGFNAFLLKVLLKSSILPLSNTIIIHSNFECTFNFCQTVKSNSIMCTAAGHSCLFMSLTSCICLLFIFFFRNVFQDILHRDTLVKAFLDQVIISFSERTRAREQYFELLVTGNLT